jgi:hypothetical protein
MFMALSRFTIANDMTDDARSAFLDRPHLVDTAPGDLGMEVVSPLVVPTRRFTKPNPQGVIKSFGGKNRRRVDARGEGNGRQLLPGLGRNLRHGAPNR